MRLTFAGIAGLCGYFSGRSAAFRTAQGGTAKSRYVAEKIPANTRNTRNSHLLGVWGLFLWSWGQ